MGHISDLVSRIKNGYLARRETITSPHSNFKEEILKKLKSLGYIKNYKITGTQKKIVEIELSYDDGVPALTNIKIYSRPGRRWYVSAKELKPILGGVASGIISTPKGILTNSEAKKEKVGGELLFEIW